MTDHRRQPGAIPLNAAGLAGLVALLLLAALLWLLLKQPPEGKPGIQTDSDSSGMAQRIAVLNERIDLLEAELTQGLVQRKALERRLARLEQSTPTNELVADSNTSLERPDDVTEENPNSNPTAAQTDDEEPDIEQRLLSAGLPPDTIQAVRQRVDSNRLEMLEYRDRAMREGANGSQEYVEQMHELNDSTRGLREEFGDRVFDEYLYASGRPNRVEVREVYSGSAAETAGIRVGDIVSRYAAESIFSMTDLRQATVAGTAGEAVLVELVRDGQPISTSITRGPMGISMSSTRLQPLR